VQRIADVDRYGTAARLADFTRTSLGWVIDDVVLATGTDFPDAEVGGPMGGVRKAPILLVAESLPLASETVCKSNATTMKAVIVQGNTFSVSAAAANACKAAAES
jgi:putative cell wall-binding protein